MKNIIMTAFINKIIDKDTERDNYDIYIYGLYQMISYIINILTILFIGVALCKVLETMFFLFCFIVIRPYAGGYHASSAIKCYIFTNIIVTVAVSIMKFIEINNIFLVCLLVINSIIIIILAPVDTKNKRLDEMEYIIYRNKTLKILVVEVVFAIVIIIINHEIVAECIILAQAVLCISLIIGKINNLLIGENKNFKNYNL